MEQKEHPEKHPNRNQANNRQQMSISQQLMDTTESILTESIIIEKGWINTGQDLNRP